MPFFGQKKAPIQAQGPARNPAPTAVSQEADSEMKRQAAEASTPEAESKRGKTLKEALQDQMIARQSDLGEAIKAGDSLKEAKVKVELARIDLELAKNDLDTAPNDEAKARSLIGLRAAVLAQRKALFDEKVISLEMKIAEAKAELESRVRAIASRAEKVFASGAAELDVLRWDEEAEKLKIAQEYPDPTLDITKASRLLPLPSANDVVLKILPDHDLPYVDDGDHLVDVTGDMEGYIMAIHANHLTTALTPLITGPPGCGKSRLAEEAARRLARRLPNCFIARITLEDDTLLRLRRFIPKDRTASSRILLAAGLLWALFEDLEPELHEFKLMDVERLILEKLRKPEQSTEVFTIALVIDEFSNDLAISERIFSGCIAAAQTKNELRVVPVFAGVHRTRVPTDMENLLGMKSRSSGQMNTRVTLLSSLSAGAEEQLVRAIANEWGISYDDVMNPKALGSVVAGCGRSPSLLVLLYMTLAKEGFEGILEEIKINKAVSTKSGSRLWQRLAKDISHRFSLTKFAEMISASEKSFELEPVSRASLDLNRPARASLSVATLVMERLAVLAMSGVEVDLAGCVLRSSDLSALRLDPASPEMSDLLRFTFQRARSMVEITPLEANPERGRVNMPLLEIAALCLSLNNMRIERALLDPFVTTPYLLEELAIESLANVVKSHHDLALSSVSGTHLRPMSHTWGRNFDLAVPKTCTVVQLADHLGVNAHLAEARTDPNGKGIPVKWEAGLFFTTAVNQPEVDGGGILKEAGTGRLAIIVSQSKFTMDYVPQSGDDGGDVPIGKSEATALLTGMRERATWIKLKLGLSESDPALCIYDMFTTRILGQRFPRGDTELFALDTNEVVMLTTKDTVRTALGPALGLRVSFAAA